MKNPLTYIPAGIAGAVISGLIWYFGNLFDHRKGQGWFDRQEFPLNNMACCIAAGAVFGLVCAFIADVFRSRRRQAMQEAALYNRLEFQPTIEKSQLGAARTLQIFKDWHEGLNWMHGRIQNVGISIFDLHREIVSRSRSSSGSSSSTRYERQTVFLLERPEPSKLTAQIVCKGPLSFAFSLMSMIGVEFEPRDGVLNDDDQGVLDAFNDKYLVTQGTSNSGPRQLRQLIPDDELLAELESVIGLHLMRKISSDMNWNVELSESHIAIWVHKRRFAPTAITGQIPQVLDIFRDLTDGTSQRSAVPLRAREPSMPTAETATRSLGVFMVGGCLGMFIAGALFVPVFFLFVKDYPWLVFVWPFFGMATVLFTVKCLAKFQARRSSR